MRWEAVRAKGRAWLRTCVATLAVAGSALPAVSPAAPMNVTRGATTIAAGQAAYARHDFRRALALWYRALPALHQANDGRAGDVLAEIASAYIELGEYGHAIAALQRALALHRALGNRRREAHDLVVLGALQEGLGRYADGLSSEQQALAIDRAIGNRPGEADALGNVGTLQEDLGQHQAALASLRGALALYRALKNRLMTAQTLSLIGNLDMNLGQFDEAAGSYRDSLQILRGLKNRYGEAAVLGDLGNAEADLGRYGDSLAHLQQALHIERAIANRLGEADTLTNIGNVQRELAHDDQALASFTLSLAAHRKLKSRSGEASDLANIGTAEFDLGRYADALSSEQQALAAHRALKDRRGEAGDLGNIGNAYFELGRYTEALASLNQSLGIDRAVGNPLGEADDLSTIGSVDLDLGRFAEALVAQQQALLMHRAVKSPLGEASDLSNIATVAVRLGRYDDALAAQQQALGIDRAIQNRLGEADELANIGVVYENLGRFADALTAEQAALTIHRAIKNRLGEAADLTGIANAEDSLRRSAEALDANQQALAIHRAIHNRIGEADSLGNIGNDETELGRYDEALGSEQQALAIQRELGNRVGESVVLGDIGVVQGILGRYAASLEVARQAVSIDMQIGLPENLWHSLRTVAAAERHLGNRDDAIADYEAALQQIERLRASLSGAERSGFFGDKLFVYDEFIAYLRELDARFPGNGYDRKALEIFERKSARAALEQIGLSAAHHFKGVDASTVAGEDAAQDAADAAQSRLSKLLSAAVADQTAIAAAQHDLADAKLHLETVETDVAARYPAYYALRHPQPLVARCAKSPCSTFVHFQQAVLEPGELVIAYDLLAGTSVLWLIDRERIRLIPIAGRADIDAAVTRLGAHIAGMVSLLRPGVRAEEKLERSAAADLPVYAADSYALYGMLVPEAARPTVAQAKRLIIVPSGSLFRLAFETLVTQNPALTSSPHYLIEDAPVSYVPSASLLAVVRGSYGKASPGRNPLLAFANPTFGADLAAATRGLSTYADLQLEAARSLLRDDAGTPATAGEVVFPPLPGTQKEADAVRLALAAPPASLLDGDAASRERLLALNAGEQLKTYQYVLFATHAVLPDEIKGLTQPAIVLAHPERGDGLVTMADVFGLSLDADFVTLSACDTGVTTDDTSGDGISGLTRAFLYAGTPAISVTLWPVDDAAAPQITPPFFAAMHSGKVDAAQALQRAKLAMLGSPNARFRHAYAWAPSVIFGDGDAGLASGRISP